MSLDKIIAFFGCVRVVVTLILKLVADSRWIPVLDHTPPLVSAVRRRVF